MQQPVLEVEEPVAQRRLERRAGDRALDEPARQGERVDDVDLPAVLVAQLGREELGRQVVAGPDRGGEDGGAAHGARILAHRR